MRNRANRPTAQEEPTPRCSQDLSPFSEHLNSGLPAHLPPDAPATEKLFRGGRVWSGASGRSLYPMKEPSLFSRKYRGLQVLMYSPEPRRERGQGGLPGCDMPHKGHLGGRKVAERVGWRVPFPGKPLRQPC